MFTIILDYVMGKAIRNSIGKFVSRFTIETRTSRRYREVKIINLQLAYDIALTLSLLEEAQIALASVKITAPKVGLNLSAKKSEAIVFNQHEHDLFTCNNEKISIVQDFKYLGSSIGDSEKNIKFRKKKPGWSVISSVRYGNPTIGNV